MVSYVKRPRDWAGGGGHDNLWKLFWRVNIFSAPEKGRNSPKHAHQNNATVLPPPLIYDRSVSNFFAETMVRCTTRNHQPMQTLFALPDVFVQDREGSKVT